MKKKIQKRCDDKRPALSSIQKKRAKEGNKNWLQKIPKFSYSPRTKYRYRYFYTLVGTYVFDEDLAFSRIYHECRIAR